MTIHPHGEGTKGQPILIRENPDGSAHIIGGAGGALTGLRIRPRAPGETAKQAAQARLEARKKARAEQIAKDKESGVYEAKQSARKALRQQRLQAEQEFIAAVAKAKGWDLSQLEFPEEKFAHLSEKAQAKMRQRHHAAVLKAAHAAAQEAADRARMDHAARMEAVGEIPLETQDPDVLSVADIDPMKADTGGGLGFNADYKGRAAAAGATPEEIAAEVQAHREAKLAAMTEDERKAALARGEATKVLHQELEAVRDLPLFSPKDEKKLTDLKSDLEILKARKKLQLIRKQAAEVSKEIDQSIAEPKAFSLAVTDDDAALEAKVREDVENDLRTIAARNFLSQVDQHDRGALGRHIGVGAYNALNALALTVAGHGLIDRSVVDVLGVAGAAQVVARRLRSALSPEEFEQTRLALEDYHASQYAQVTADALAKAKEFQAAAESIELPDKVASADDLQLAQDLNAKRREAIGEARRVLGTVLGETEANAALVAAMQGQDPESLEVPLGATTEAAAITQARALGLQPGDYQLDRVGSELFLTVNAQGMERLAEPVNREDLAQLKRSQAIIRGDMDEEGWLPLGFASRPDLATDVKPGVAPRLARPFEAGPDLERSLKDYIGGRMADGDAPADILADIQSADFIQKSGRAPAEYRAVLDTIAPTKGADGKLMTADALAPIFDQYADEYVEREYGGARSTLNKQTFDVDHKAVEALHRALSDHPEGVAAYKQVGELTPQDQRALRDFFARNIAKESPDEAKLRQRLEALDASEPERMTTDMFGETSVNPAWQEWKAERDKAAAEYNSASLNWPKYVAAMKSTAKAYETVQDLIRSHVESKFAEHYNRLNPDKPLKVGVATVRNNLTHLDTIDPQARAERAAKEAALRDALRERVSGKYAAGSVLDKLDAFREQKQAFEQAQMGFFSSDGDLFGGGDEQPGEPPARQLAADERHTVGHVAGRQVAKMMSVVGQNFKPGQPVKLWNPSMSGKYAPQQRAIKLLEANKRLGGALGAGSGKTAIMLGGFSHLHSKGKVKRAIMLVPSVVQGQFAGEALRYLQPGKYKWHIEPGASREERIAAYKDPSNHFCVMTHQSFRDDMIHLGAKHAGVDEGEMTKRVNAMTPDERQEWMRSVMEKEGINFDMTMVDEAHETVNRAGKENSTLSNVVDALSDNTPYYGYFSGDPVKNDASEIHSVLAKLDRKRYGDRDAFMRKYGADTLASKEALRRELSRYVFPNRISSGVNAERKTVTVDLTEGQKQALRELDAHFAAARLARKRGEVNLEAMRAISPGSFEGVPESEHMAIADRLQKSLGIMRSSAIRRVINSHPDNAKIDAMLKEVEARPGKQGVIFAHARADIEAIRKRLEAAGKRVVTITGADSAAEKDRKRKMFNPEQGEAQADILLASDAGAVGMNLQSGRYLIQHDIPDTAKTHGQRNARIDRIGQKHDVELIDLVANHREEFRARDRLQKKYELRDLMTSPMDGLDDTGFAWFLKKRQAAESGHLPEN